MGWRLLRGGALVVCLASLAIAPAAAAANPPITVSNTLSSGPGSLADAIQSANAVPGMDTIGFAIDLPGSQQRISQSVAMPLPNVTGPIVLDGRSQGIGPNYTGPPLIQIVGCPTTLACAPTPANASETTGLHLLPGAAGSTVQGLSVARFNQGGIVVEAPSTTLKGNYVGVDFDGTGGVGNGKGGIVVKTAGVRVGGTASGDANVIGDNHDFCGIDVQSGTGTAIRGNLIGTDSTGVAGLGNSPSHDSCGVRVEGSAAQTEIGGTGAAGNVIADNDVNGVEILGGTGASIQGNLIGLGSTGQVLGNHGNGVLISGGTGTVIGGAARNYLSGNFNGAGVLITGGAAVVQGNSVGVGTDGVTPRSNQDGVLVGGGTITIGGETPGTGNLISGNALTGVTLASGSVGNKVYGNQVGGDVNGGPLANNATQQIRVTGTASGNQIGSLSGGGNTVIDVNGSGPIVLDGAGTGNTVRGNAVLLNGSTFTTAIDRLVATGVPQLTSVYTSAGRSQVLGTLAATPLTSYALDLYADGSCDSATHRGIDRYFSSASVTTDAAGQAVISVPVDTVPLAGERLLAAVTDPLGTTSELGSCAGAAEAAPTLQLSAATFSGPESSRVAHVTITRAGGGLASAGVRLRTTDGTARAGADYTAVDTFATVNADQTSTTVDIPIADDGKQAGNRSFTVDLALPNTAVLGALNHATVTVVDDTPNPPDTRPPPTKPPPTRPPVIIPPKVVVSPATVTITSPHGTVKHTKVKLVSGKSKTTKAAKVRKIQVALTRTATCERLASHGTLVRIGARQRKACPPRWLTAKGTTTWALKLKHRLPSGTYRIAVRALDVNGHAGKVRSVTVKLR